MMAKDPMTATKREAHVEVSQQRRGVGHPNDGLGEGWKMKMAKDQSWRKEPESVRQLRSRSRRVKNQECRCR